MKNYTVVWSPKANKSLRNIYDFILSNSPQGAKNVVKELVQVSQTLQKLPYRYAIEPLLAQEAVEYRYLVKWNYKLIYVVEEESDNVIIVQVFDTRQQPKKLVV